LWWDFHTTTMGKKKGLAKKMTIGCTGPDKKGKGGGGKMFCPGPYKKATTQTYKKTGKSQKKQSGVEKETKTPLQKTR